MKTQFSKPRKKIRIALAATLTAIMAVTICTTPTQAHEGHSHGPGAEAPHGGEVKEGKNLNMELVKQGESIHLYPLDKKGNSIAAKDVRLNVTSQAPKKDRKTVDLKSQQAHFEGKLDAKGARRVEVKIEATWSGKKDNFTFQVEPEG